MRPHLIISILSAVGTCLAARGPRVGGPARAFILASLMGVSMCLADGTKAADAERWIHPAFSATTLQLPGTFDQQTVVVLDDGRLMTVHPKGNATVVSGTCNEVFRVLGGERNLGVAVNAFYQHKAIGYAGGATSHQNTTASPAYAYDYRTRDIFYQAFKRT